MKAMKKYRSKFNEAEADVTDIIKEIIETKWSHDDPSERGKVLALFKGIIFSDDERARKFMSDLDDLTDKMDEKKYM